MSGNIPKCLQVLKNRQMQKNEARVKQQNNTSQSKKFPNQQTIQRSFDNENTNNNQHKITNFDESNKKQRKPLESLNNVNLQSRYIIQQQNQTAQNKQVLQDQPMQIQQKRQPQNQPIQYSPPDEDYTDNYYNNFSNDISNSNIDDSPVQNYQPYSNQFSPPSKDNFPQFRNKNLSSPQEHYSKSGSSLQSHQNVQSFSNNFNDPQYMDIQEYKMLIERNKTLEKQIEILQLNQKSLSELNNHSAQLEDALNRISDLEQMLSAKEKKFQIATDAIAQFQSEINELTSKYKQQGKELLQAQKRIKDLELTNEDLLSQINEFQYNKKFYDDDVYSTSIDSNKSKYLLNQGDYIDEDRFDSKRKLSRYPDDLSNDSNKINSFNKRGRFDDDDAYADYQNNKYNEFEQPSSKYCTNYNMENNRGYDYNQNYQNDSQMNRYGQQRSFAPENEYDNRNSFNKPNRINQETALSTQNAKPKSLNQNKEMPFSKQSVHPAMKDNLFFGDDQPEKKDNYDLIVQELRDDEIQRDFESFTREKEEKERILNKAPEKGISISKSRRMKEQLDDEIDDLSRKISILKREMKQRGLYC